MGIDIASGRKTSAGPRRYPPFASNALEPATKVGIGVSKRELINTIRAAWKSVGVEINVWLEADGEIRSATTNGMPSAAKQGEGQ